MSCTLISHSPDLKRLFEEGLELEIAKGFLLVHHVPYVNSKREVKYGTLVTALDMAGDKTVAPGSHVIYFNGEHPCNKDGSIIHQIQHASGRNILADGVVIDHAFSNRPPNGYPDYYQKVTTYIAIISGPAKSLDASVSEKTFQVIEPDPADSVFNYLDTNSTRAGIGTISAKLENQKIAIIGLGGTGSYILDFVAKTPVKEIHLFDGDDFFSHNAFRAPGAPSVEQLRQRYKKAAYFKDIYSNMHRGIIDHEGYIDPGRLNELQGMDYVFMSFEGEMKGPVVDYLEQNNIRFIDVGMGLHTVDDQNQLIGMLRVTSSTEHRRDHVRKRVSFSKTEENEYSQNIQIAELNALNAAMAIIKWKKLCGFYQDLEKENYSTYSINVSQLLNEDYDPNP